MAPVALITGAGTGIGRAAAQALAADGYAIVLAGRTPSALESAAATLPVPTLVVPTDVRDPDQVRSLFDAVGERFGRLDLLFNNAGTGAPAVPLEDLDLDRLRAVIDTNVLGTFLCSREALRMMKGQDPPGGRIINNGSISAHAPRPHSAPYTATKHAVTGLTKSLALDGRAHRIAVTQLDIGNAATEMTQRMAEGVPQADGSVRVEPLMDVDHVGRAVSYAASLPLEATVLFMTVMATTMPFVGRG